MYQVTCKQINYYSNKVSGAESGVHTATLPHGEAHTSEGEQAYPPRLAFCTRKRSFEVRQFFSQPRV